MLTHEPDGPTIGASLFANACMKFKATGRVLSSNPLLKSGCPQQVCSGGKIQFHTQALQNMGHILKRGGVELVAEAGNKELGFWHDCLSQERLMQATIHTDDLPCSLAEFAAAQQDMPFQLDPPM